MKTISLLALQSMPKDTFGSVFGMKLVTAYKDDDMIDGPEKRVKYSKHVRGLFKLPGPISAESQPKEICVPTNCASVMAAVKGRVDSRRTDKWIDAIHFAEKGMWEKKSKWAEYNKDRNYIDWEVPHETLEEWAKQVARFQTNYFEGPIPEDIENCCRGYHYWTGEALEGTVSWFSYGASHQSQAIAYKLAADKEEQVGAKMNYTNQNSADYVVLGLMALSEIEKPLWSYYVSSSKTPKELKELLLQAGFGKMGEMDKTTASPWHFSVSQAHDYLSVLADLRMDRVVNLSTFKCAEPGAWLNHLAAWAVDAEDMDTLDVIGIKILRGLPSHEAVYMCRRNGSGIDYIAKEWKLPKLKETKEEWQMSFHDAKESSEKPNLDDLYAEQAYNLEAVEKAITKLKEERAAAAVKYGDKIKKSSE